MWNKLRTCPEWGSLVLRLMLAAVFLYHGTQKWALWQAASGAMPESTLLLMKVLSIVEPLAGLAVLLGLFTRTAASALAVIMLGAIYFKIKVMNVGFVTATGPGWEFDLTLLAAAVALVCFGAGKYALDSVVWKKKDVSAPPAA